MTTERLLQIIHDRNLSIVFAADGQPALRGQGAKEMATPELMAVIKIHREKLLALARPSEVKF